MKAELENKIAVKSEENDALREALEDELSDQQVQVANLNIEKEKYKSEIQAS